MDLRDWAKSIAKLFLEASKISCSSFLPINLLTIGWTFSGRCDEGCKWWILYLLVFLGLPMLLVLLYFISYSSISNWSISEPESSIFSVRDSILMYLALSVFFPWILTSLPAGYLLKLASKKLTWESFASLVLTYLPIKTSLISSLRRSIMFLISDPQSNSTI